MRYKLLLVSRLFLLPILLAIAGVGTYHYCLTKKKEFIRYLVKEELKEMDITSDDPDMLRALIAECGTDLDNKASIIKQMDKVIEDYYAYSWNFKGDVSTQDTTATKRK